MITAEHEHTAMYSTDLCFIEKAADKIQQQLSSGEIMEACCMSAISTPVTESWEAAQELSERYSLTATQQHALLQALNPQVQQQLQATGFDDFDLIYERLLQLVIHE